MCDSVIVLANKKQNYIVFRIVACATFLCWGISTRKQVHFLIKYQIIHLYYIFTTRTTLEKERNNATAQLLQILNTDNEKFHSAIVIILLLNNKSHDEFFLNSSKSIKIVSQKILVHALHSNRRRRIDCFPPNQPSDRRDLAICEMERLFNSNNVLRVWSVGSCIGYDGCYFECESPLIYSNFILSPRAADVICVCLVFRASVF